jgi:hypothetical protein
VTARTVKVECARCAGTKVDPTMGRGWVSPTASGATKDDCHGCGGYGYTTATLADPKIEAAIELAEACVGRVDTLRSGENWVPAVEWYYAAIAAYRAIEKEGEG